jgi:hypothetical protein
MLRAFCVFKYSQHRKPCIGTPRLCTSITAHPVSVNGSAVTHPRRTSNSARSYRAIFLAMLAIVPTPVATQVAPRHLPPTKQKTTTSVHILANVRMCVIAVATLLPRILSCKPTSQHCMKARSHTSVAFATSPARIAVTLANTNVLTKHYARTDAHMMAVHSSPIAAGRT